MGFPLLQKSGEMCVDRQIKVLGSYWKGHMSNKEVNSQYKCTVGGESSAQVTQVAGSGALSRTDGG